MNFAVPIKYVCKIIALLQKDRDPSPPLLPARFMQHDYRQELVVAEAYPDESDTSLHAGDVTVGVEGAEVVVHDETQLVQLLRGEHGNRNLRIVRDGEYHSVPIDAQPAKSITQRTGIYVSGLVIASSSYVNERRLDIAKMPMVHSVKAGTVGQPEGIEAWDIIKTVGGKKFEGIEELFACFSDALENGRDVEIVIKRIDDSGYRLSSYMKISLPIDDLKRIGPEWT
jgi:C-terminal processing protease CtpA/Prc